MVLLFHSQECTPYICAVNRIISIIGKSLNTLSILAPKTAGKIAFKLFCTPRKGRYTERTQKYVDKADDKEPFSCSSGRIQAYHWNPTGSKKVLLLHGWESNSQRWRFIINRLLESNAHIISIDAPAHGGSDGKIFTVPSYAEAIKQVTIKHNPDVIIGHSIGGGSLLYALSEYPELNPERIVLMGVPKTLKQMIDNFASILQLSERAIGGIGKHFRSSYNMTIEAQDYSAHALKVKAKTLVIHDRIDKIAPYQNGVDIAAKINDVTFMTTDNLGHSLQDKEVYAEIINFIKEVG